MSPVPERYVPKETWGGGVKGQGQAFLPEIQNMRLENEGITGSVSITI